MTIFQHVSINCLEEGAPFLVDTKVTYVVEVGLSGTEKPSSWTLGMFDMKWLSRGGWIC